MKQAHLRNGSQYKLFFALLKKIGHFIVDSFAYFNIHLHGKGKTTKQF